MHDLLNRTGARPASNRTLYAMASAFFIIAAASAAPSEPPLNPDPPASDSALSFDQARAQLAAKAPAIKAAQARYSSKKDTAASLKALSYPEVSLDVHYFTYERTFNDKQFSIDSADISGVPLSLPSGALDHLKYNIKVSQTPFQPVISASWVLYSGGEITAAKGAAAAFADQAGSQLEEIHEALDLELVRLYFGQQLSLRVLALRKELLEGMREHLDNAVKLEIGGLVTRGQRLQAQVAYDAAKRGYDASEHDLTRARIGLAALLKSSTPIMPTTDLFVLKTPLNSLDAYLAKAHALNPHVRSIEELQRAATYGAQAAKARWKPKVYVFGNYNFYRNGEVLTDVDWAAGIGVHWSIFDKIDRRKNYSAAKQTIIEATEAAEFARDRVDADTKQAYDGILSALKQFNLLASNLESARENLRVQELSFREGQGISTDVTNARIALTNVLVERAIAAYQFDLQLAAMLHACGQMDHFTAYLNQEDKIIP